MVKTAPSEVVSVRVRESAYYGGSKCALARSSSPLASAFSVVEGPLGKDRTKYCTLLLLADNFTQTTVEVNLLLLVDPSSKSTSSCDNVVADRARIEVTFTPGWEIVNNVVTRPRAEKSDKQLSRPNTRFDGDQQIFSGGVPSGGQGGFEGGRNGAGRLETGNQEVDIGQEPDDNSEQRLLMGLALMVTLVAFSLILGLIYFWCPGLCSCGCWSCFQGEKSDLESTKILTVRDSDGRVIHDAASVEVWKTRQNKIKNLNVMDQGGPAPRMTKKSRPLTPELSPSKSPGLKMIHAGPDLDGLIILRRPRSHERGESRVTYLEEVTPRHQYRSSPPSHRTTVEEVEVVRVNRDREPLAFSRHYSGDSRESSRGRGSSREDRRDDGRKTREVREPLSKQLARNLRGSFNDDNRTPSPDNTMVGDWMAAARQRRRNE